MNRLITIPFSHYCEKARWALDRARVPYVEEGHAPLFHWRASYGSGGKRTVPVLVTDSGVLSDSTDIVKFADAAASADRKLYSTPEAAELEDLFDEKLGPAIRRVGYFYLLPDRARAKELVRRGIPRVEQLLLAPLFPLAVLVIKRGLHVDQAGADRSLARVREIFATVSSRLAGRKFLVGDRFGVADLTFASLSSPLVQPPNHPMQFPEVSGALRTLVEELRATPAGKHVMKMYADERN